MHSRPTGGAAVCTTTTPPLYSTRCAARISGAHWRMECTLLPCPPAPPKARVACEGLRHLAWRCVRVGTAWEGLRNGTRVCANLRQIYHGRLTGDMAAARPTGPEPEIAGLARNEAAGRHLCHHTSTGGCPVASNEGRVARCAMVPFVNVRKVNPSPVVSLRRLRLSGAIP